MSIAAVIIWSGLLLSFQLMGLCMPARRRRLLRAR